MKTLCLWAFFTLLVLLCPYIKAQSITPPDRVFVVMEPLHPGLADTATVSDTVIVKAIIQLKNTNPVPVTLHARAGTTPDGSNLLTRTFICDSLTCPRNGNIITLDLGTFSGFSEIHVKAWLEDSSGDTTNPVIVSYIP